MKTIPSPTTDPERSRSVKISDRIHHKIRVKAAIHRLPMQVIMDRLLEAGLKSGDVSIWNPIQ